MDYSPRRFLLHLGLMAVSVVVLLPVALVLGGGNPYITMGLWLGLWVSTSLLRLFLLNYLMPRIRAPGE